MEWGSNEIIGGIIGLGLVIKGVAEWWIRYAAKKTPAALPPLPPVERGCLYGDEAHRKIEAKIDAECGAIKDILIECRTILRERK